MKMKKILKMPLRRMPRRTSAAESLRAKANAGTYEKEDYETEEEPNMKFSHALMVVLALHVIAVGGVFAFNSIKAGQAAAAKTAAKEEVDRPPAPAIAQPKPSADGERHRRVGRSDPYCPGGRYPQSSRLALQDQR